MSRIILLLILNFGALALGSYLIGNPAENAWYQGLDKAPWTPPGWVFGAAWFTIMLCFTFFMAQALKESKPDDYRFLIILFIIQWILNVSWNPVFFRWHMVSPGLVLIICLTIVVGVFAYIGLHRFKIWGLLMLPYLIWLCIATSLNAYILVKN